MTSITVSDVIQFINKSEVVLSSLTLSLLLPPEGLQSEVNFCKAVSRYFKFVAKGYTSSVGFSQVSFGAFSDSLSDET